MTYLFVFCLGFICCAVLDVMIFNHFKSKLIKQLEKEIKYSGDEPWSEGVLYALKRIERLKLW